MIVKPRRSKPICVDFNGISKRLPLFETIKSMYLSKYENAFGLPVQMYWHKHLTFQVIIAQPSSL